jgi:hypothetical protein
LAVVLSAVMVKAVADMVAAYTGQARVIDRNTLRPPGTTG